MDTGVAPEWLPFRVGAPLPPPEFALNCKPFETISHVAHRETALTILREGMIRAGLVYDESRLNTARLQVTWLSPNYWTEGFRYGNARFTFDWRQLITGKRAYWVETIPYRPPACRILITERSIDDPNLILLTPYDPTQGNGPWWYDQANDQHYFNSTYALEIMLDDQVPLRICQKLDFVTHHAQQCSVNPRTCPDRYLHASQAGVQIIAALISRAIAVPVGLLTSRQEQAVIPSQELVSVCHRLWSDLYPVSAVCTGMVDVEHASASALAHAILAAYARSREAPDIHQIAALFQSGAALIHSCKSVVAEAFQITDPTALRADEWAGAAG